MTITPEILDKLRFKEGCPGVYEEIDINLELTRGRGLSAFTYIINPKMALQDDFGVTANYRRLILAGAKKFNFSPQYQEALRQELKIVPSLRFCTENAKPRSRVKSSK